MLVLQFILNISIEFLFQTKQINSEVLSILFYHQVYVYVYVIMSKNFENKITNKLIILLYIKLKLKKYYSYSVFSLREDERDD